MITIMWPCVLANPIMSMVFTLVEVKQAPDEKIIFSPTHRQLWISIACLKPGSMKLIRGLSEKTTLTY